MKKLFLLTTAALSITLLNVNFAIASSAAGHQTSFADTYKFWPSFAVFLALITYLLKTPLLTFWASRRVEIEEAVSAGERELEQANKLLQESQARLAKLDDEIQTLTENISEDAQRESQKLVQEAIERSKRIANQALSSVEAERKSAEVALRQQLADYVVSQAEKRIRAEMSTDSDAQLRQAAVGEIKTLLN